MFEVNIDYSAWIQNIVTKVMRYTIHSLLIEYQLEQANTLVNTNIKCVTLKREDQIKHCISLTKTTPLTSSHLSETPLREAAKAESIYSNTYILNLLVNDRKTQNWHVGSNICVTFYVQLSKI